MGADNEWWMMHGTSFLLMSKIDKIKSEITTFHRIEFCTITAQCTGGIQDLFTFFTAHELKVKH